MFLCSQPHALPIRRTMAVKKTGLHLNPEAYVMHGACVSVLSAEPSVILRSTLTRRSGDHGAGFLCMLIQIQNRPNFSHGAYHPLTYSRADFLRLSYIHHFRPPKYRRRQSLRSYSTMVLAALSPSHRAYRHLTRS